MAKRYESGLIGMDVKPHRHRLISPNRYRSVTKRRWLIPAAVAITLVGLAVIAGVWP